MIGYPELIIILVIVLLLFGANKLPEVARSLGESAKEFKKAQVQTGNELKNSEESPKGNNTNKDVNDDADSDKKIRKLAIEMGIDIKDKTIEQLTDEIRTRVTLRADK